MMWKGCWTLIGAMLLIASIIAAVLIAQSFVPEELAPSRTELPDGSVRFVLQSHREAISWPVGAATVVVFSIAWSYLIPRLRPGEREEKRRPHIALRVLYFGPLSFIALLFAVLVLFHPLFTFRALVLTSDGLSLSSLYRTWSVPMDDIASVHIDREDRSSRGGPCTDLRYEVRGVGGYTHRSVAMTHTRPSNELTECIEFLESVDSEVQERLQR